MDGLRGMTVCVDYDDILALTLHRNMRHLSECVVVTSHDDERTAEVVRGVQGAQLFQTDAFTRDEAVFNKGLAIEEGFDVLGRSGWILILDADIVLPEVFKPGSLDQNVLYGAPRRQLPDGILDFGGDWSRWKVVNDQPCVGYFQLFHAEAEVLRSRPWYAIDSPHAGNSDWWFRDKFTKKMLARSVLHIGRRYENWYGRAMPRLDGTPIPDADQKRLRIGEYFLGEHWGRRTDLQKLALAANQIKNGIT
jgi:hypothetical protein